MGDAAVKTNGETRISLYGQSRLPCFAGGKYAGRGEAVDIARVRRRIMMDGKVLFHRLRFQFPMSHQVAKLILEQAGTFVERTEAVKSALQLGMPLGEIEDYLDWLDMVRSGCQTKQNPSQSTDEAIPEEDET